MGEQWGLEKSARGLGQDRWRARARREGPCGGGRTDLADLLARGDRQVLWPKYLQRGHTVERAQDVE